MSLALQPIPQPSPEVPWMIDTPPDRRSNALQTPDQPAVFRPRGEINAWKGAESGHHLAGRLLLEQLPNSRQLLCRPKVAVAAAPTRDAVPDLFALAVLHLRRQPTGVPPSARDLLSKSMRLSSAAKRCFSMPGNVPCAAQKGRPRAAATACILAMHAACHTA